MYWTNSDRLLVSRGIYSQVSLATVKDMLVAGGAAEGTLGEHGAELLKSATAELKANGVEPPPSQPREYRLAWICDCWYMCYARLCPPSPEDTPLMSTCLHAQALCAADFSLLLQTDDLMTLSAKAKAKARLMLSEQLTSPT